MSPSRRVLTFALTMMTVAAFCGATASFAQYFESTSRTAGLPSEITRSPRLLGMGRLTLSVPDRDQQIALWDLCGNPTGLFWDDSVSTLDIRPGTGSTANAHDIPDSRIREDLTGRLTSFPFEVVHRNDKGSAFGVVGELRSVRRETPISSEALLHRSVGDPNIVAIANGPFPWLMKDKLRYALRLRVGSESVTDEYRHFSTNDMGEFMTQEGALTDSPNFFDPVDWRVTTQGLGLAFSYPLGRSHVLAVGADALHQRVRGTNDGGRHTSEVREERPLKVGQASLVGHLGSSIEYGVDGRGWLAKAPQDYVFTLSAGVGGVPLRGNGHLLEREEKGSSLDSRVRWTSGATSIGGQFWTRAGKLEITPPHPNDGTSLNRFLSWAWYRAGSDTLVFPDSISRTTTDQRAWGYGAGASYKFKRGVAGVEWHWSRDLTNQTLTGEGPRRIDHDVRAGLEYVCTNIITGRLGMGVLASDMDDLSHGNEFVGQTASVGMGLRPKGTTWGFDAGYAIEWYHSDYGDPQDHRGSRQQLLTQVHWGF